MQRPAFLGWSQCLKVQIEMGQSSGRLRTCHFNRFPKELSSCTSIEKNQNKKKKKSAKLLTNIL